jgi:hypothetical protein
MLSPEARAVAIDFLRPPAGYTLDQAVLTTFSLDLEALLALPLAVLAHADGGVEEVLADPLLLLEALRGAGNRVHVFVDEGGIAIPRSERSMYALLEASVHPVRAPNGGAFHPKVWFARFVRDGQPPLLRVSVLSRNLTFDQSWDIALTSEASPEGQRRKRVSRELGDLLRLLPGVARQTVPAAVAEAIEAIALEVERCAFPAPEGFSETAEFIALGIHGPKRALWQPLEHGTGLLAISPFLTRAAVDSLADAVRGEKTLISRQDALDALPEESLEKWTQVYVLSDAAASELDDESSDRPDGLHAKVVAIEHGWNVSWFVGSANLTNAAYRHLNVEMMAAVTGKKSKHGIGKFLEAGFIGLCEHYARQQSTEIVSELAEAKEKLEAARKALLAEGALSIDCSEADDRWRLRLTGEIDLPAGIEVHVWPVSLGEQSARMLDLPVEWLLPAERLTAFIAFRISAPGIKVDNLRMTLLLPATGLPDNRMNHVLRSLIDSPERFLQFLRALLGGLDGLVDWSQGQDTDDGSFSWGSGLSAESLLEDLVRIASREPERLQPVRRLIRDLRETEEGRHVVNDELLAVWNAVDDAVGKRGQA